MTHPTVTNEAMRTYLNVIKPDGVVIMHLSNRHLSLAPAVAAVVKDAGGYGLYQYHYPQPGMPEFTDTGEEAIIVGRNAAALADFAAMPGDLWTSSDPQICGAKAWTDDYSNLFGSLVRGTAQQRGLMRPVAQALLGKEGKACYGE